MVLQNGDYDAGVDDLGYRELYVRWFQYGAFLPMFRSHGTDTPREIWRFGEQGEQMYTALTKFLELRYRLLPYIYSLAGWTTHESYTMLRALPFDFRNDPQTHDLGDQFMFGPAFLVVSLGTDTSAEDRLGAFALPTDTFATIGRRIAELSLPTLVVQEGGYHVGSMGRCVTNFLGGLDTEERVKR